MSRLRPLALGLVLVLVAACGGPAAAPATPAAPLPTPLASLGPALEGTVAALSGALAGLGLRLDPPAGPYRPSEPERLLRTPRAIFQAGTGDPGQGYVVLYQLVDDPDADAAARELAAYLGSGFGQTNFPVDAQLHVARDGSVVIFTWWSREKSADPARAEAAWAAIASVGQEIPVRK